MEQINITLSLYGSVVCLILLLYLWMNNNKAEKSNRFFIGMCLFNIGMMLGDIPAWAFEGFARDWYPAVLKIGSVINFACSAPLLLSFAGYLLECYPVRTDLRGLLWRLAVTLCGIQLLCSVLSYWNGMYFTTGTDNIYRRGDWFWLSQLIPFLIILMDAALIFVCRKHIRKRDVYFLSSFILFFSIAQFFQIFNYGIELTNVGATVSILLMFTHIQSRRELRMEQQEHELTQSRQAVMISQIQPHFLYNSLAAIQQLCTIDPRAAEETVVEFAEYLRGNLDSLSINKPIPFEKELRHVEIYLKIEKKRFGEKLNVVYDIKAKDFQLPALTLQPVVENAVRCGITKKENGGTVTIKTEEMENKIVIKVTDDGVGFDSNEQLAINNEQLIINN